MHYYINESISLSNCTSDFAIKLGIGFRTGWTLVLTSTKPIFQMEEDREVPGSKRRWKSIPRLRLRGVNSVTRFCLFSKVRSGLTAGNTPVYLNVYDLTPMNGYAYWAGFGIFHSGVEGTSYFCFKCCLGPFYNYLFGIF